MSVHAVIVGIEHYDCLKDGIDLELDGPASDAVRFSGLCLARGVPPQNIHLFLNALDLPARRAELDAFPQGLQVNIQKPVRDIIEDFFTNQLPKLDGGTLYLLWGGHGVMRDGMERHLFYENIRAASPLTFPLDTRLAELRRSSNFSAQNVFIDACANYVELTQFPGLAATPVVLSARIQFVTQDVLCAAASGEKAKNDLVRRTGLFSDILFQQFGTEGGWPSAKDLALRIEAEFLERAKTDPNYRFRPVWLSFRADDGSGFDRGSIPRGPRLQELAELAACATAQLSHLAEIMFAPLADVTLRDRLFNAITGPIARRSRASTLEDCAELAAWTLLKNRSAKLRDELINAGIAEAGHITNELDRTKLAMDAYGILHRVFLLTAKYKNLLHRIEPNAPWAISLEEVLYALAAQGPLKRNKLFRLVLEVTQIIDDEDARQKLRTLAQMADANFVADIRAELDSRREYRILLTVTDSSNLAWGIRLCNGIPEPPRRQQPVDPAGGLLPAFEALYQQLISDLDPDLVTSVEVILKPDQLRLKIENAGIPLEAGIPTEPLCERFPVALRWRDRILKPAAYRSKEWQEAARKINALDRQATVYRLAAPAPRNQWMQPPLGHVLDLVCIAEDSTGSALAVALYNGGVPFACWHRTVPGATYEAAIRDFVTAVADYEKLPRLLPTERAKRAEVQALALFWDDPATDPATLIKTYEEQV